MCLYVSLCVSISLQYSIVCMYSIYVYARGPPENGLTTPAVPLSHQGGVPHGIFFLETLSGPTQLRPHTTHTATSVSPIGPVSGARGQQHIRIDVCGGVVTHTQPRSQQRVCVYTHPHTHPHASRCTMDSLRLTREIVQGCDLHVGAPFVWVVPFVVCALFCLWWLRGNAQRNKRSLDNNKRPTTSLRALVYSAHLISCIQERKKERKEERKKEIHRDTHQ
jgi:hypothetical protein